VLFAFIGTSVLAAVGWFFAGGADPVSGDQAIGSAQTNQHCNADANSGYHVIQQGTSGPSYTIPADGTLDSWTIATLPAGDPVTAQITAHLEVWRANGGGSYTLIHMSAGQVVNNDGGSHTFPLAPPLAVTGGDIIGLGITAGDGGCLFSTGNAGDVEGAFFGPVTVGNSYTATDFDFANYQANISANFVDALQVPSGAVLAQCFNITDGNDPNEPVSAYTLDFGSDDFTVRRATQFCEIATKDGTGDMTTVARYLCHTITGGHDPNDGITLFTDNFGDDEVTVRASTMLCRPGQKQVCDSQYSCEGVISGNLGLPFFQCFNVTGGDDPNRQVELETSNFGSDDVTIRRSTRMCEFAYEEGDIPFFGNLRGQCFTLTGGQDANQWINMEMSDLGDPTGPLEADTVRVRAAVMMCEGVAGPIGTIGPSGVPGPTGP
jgi:hypothetical protein